MKKTLLVITSVALVFSAFTIVTNQWYPLPEKTAIKFLLPNADNAEGTFSGLQAKIKFNPAKPQKGRIEALVDVATIQTGIKKRDDHLKSADFFDAEKYPVIKFKSTSVAGTDSGFVAKGILTMKDVSKEIEMPFTFEDTTFRGKIEVMASDYGVMTKSPTSKDKVIITLEVPVTK